METVDSPVAAPIAAALAISDTSGDPAAAAYWKQLEALKVHRGFAARYRQTLEKFIDRTNRDVRLCTADRLRSQMIQRRKIAENVRNYLAHFCLLCGERPESHTKAPNISMLNAIQKTLQAVYKRMGIDGGSFPGDSAPGGDGATVGFHELLHAATGVGGSGAVAAGRAGTQPPIAYNTRALTWNSQWSRNAEERYCYCGKNTQEPCVSCTMCKNWFHASCTSVPDDPAQFLPFMVNYKYTCSACAGRETFELRPCSWIESVIGAVSAAA